MTVSRTQMGEDAPENTSDAPEALPVDTGALGDGIVQIAYLHPHTISHSFHESLLGLYRHDALNRQRVVTSEGPLMISCGSGGLVSARNLAVERFLQGPHEWLLFIDTDMGFKADAVDRLLEAADPRERPVVGALCFMLKEIETDGYGGRRVMPAPTLFRLARDTSGQIGFANRFTYPENTLVQVAGTGAAFLLIHRSVLESIQAHEGAGVWFDPVSYQNGQPISEDLSFCYRVNQVGAPIYVHTGVGTTHHKQVWIGPADYQQPEREPLFTGPSDEQEVKNG